MAILFRHGFHACDDGVYRLPAGRTVDGGGKKQYGGVAIRRRCSQSRNTGFVVEFHAPRPAPSTAYCSLTAYRSGPTHGAAFPLDEYPAWCVVTSQISDPLMMRSGSSNSVAPSGPSDGTRKPPARAPTLFFGTEIDSVTAKVGYSFSA